MIKFIKVDNQKWHVSIDNVVAGAMSKCNDMFVVKMDNGIVIEAASHKIAKELISKVYSPSLV